MSSGDLRRFGYFPRSRPRQVQGGIKARSRKGDIGETWWSKRFIEVLESFDFSSRLQRGRSYARRGQVLELKVSAGEVEARVQGSRARPYRVRIAVKTLGPKDWDRAERAMASKAVFAAKLLAGEMPREIEDAFSACKLSLFPAAGRELASACSCPDWASPCKHVAAAFYILAEAFDADPFLVFTWRGRTKEGLIESLRALRGGGDAGPEDGMPELDPPGSEAPTPLPDSAEEFWHPGPGLEELRIKPWVAEVPDALLRQLGPPPAELGLADLPELLAPAYAAMARAAQRRALGNGDREALDRPG
jgi:uncharacterized Zn finger protein